VKKNVSGKGSHPAMVGCNDAIEGGSG